MLPAFSICVWGKFVNVEVEIVDANFDYNILLRRNWVYIMDAIVSSLFRILCFPHEGIIITVDQMAYSPNNPNTSYNSTIPLAKNSKNHVENLGVGMYSSLMITFDLPSPISYVNFISFSKVAPRRGSLELIIFQILGPYSPLLPH